MAPLDFIDRYVEKAKPFAMTAAQRAEFYAQSIICKLDQILDAVQSEEYEEQRRPFYATITAGAAGETELAQVPTGQVWELEYLSVVAACSVTITESGNFKYAKQFNNADVQIPFALIFQGGSVIHIATTGNATPVRIFLQFKVQMRKTGRATRSAGDVVQAPQNLLAREAADVMPQHFARDNVVEGVNVHGERATA